MVQIAPSDTALLTGAQMYEADRQAVARGVSSLTLMENAGRGCAEQIALRFDPGPVLVYCGTGNNGGDGFVVARHLAARGWPVRVAVLGDPAAIDGDAAAMRERWSGPVEDAAGLEPDAGLVVDALFGAGLSRPVEGRARALVKALNDAPCRTVAIDVPSGLDADTGRPRGVAVAADLTVTFFRKKPGHVLLPGRELCGHTVVIDIGIPPAVLDEVAPSSAENAPPLWRADLPRPSQSDHKYVRGHAVVASGPPAATGAARLAARAALRIGAGLVSVASPLDAVAENAAQLTAVMVKPVRDPQAFGRLLDDRRISAVLVGPGAGVGGDTRTRVRCALASGAATVLDADGITSFAGSVDELAAAIAEHPDRPVALTPHEGEFARLSDGVDLFPETEAETPARHRRALALARRLAAIVVLKGADTVIAAPDGRAAINANAPPWLATAGAGDVLAGMIAGLLAQRMDPFSAACAAVWLHGDAAARFGRGLIAEDLADLLPCSLQALGPAP